MKAIRLTEEEAVRRAGDRYQIGDKVYGESHAPFGVGYILAIDVYGVHFGFRAQIDSILLEEPKWVDSRNLTKESPIEDDILEQFSGTNSTETSMMVSS